MQPKRTLKSTKRRTPEASLARRTHDVTDFDATGFGR